MLILLHPFRMAEQDVQNVDELTALDSAREVFGMPALKYIEVCDHVNSQTRPVQFEEPTSARRP